MLMRFLQIQILGAEFILINLLVRILAKRLLPKRYIVILWDFIMLSFLLPFFFTLRPLSGTNYLSSLSTTITTVNHGISEIMMRYLPPLKTIWLMGTVLILSYFTITYLISVHKFRKANIITDSFLIDWLSLHNIKRKIEIRESIEIDSPLTFGFLHPVILLPMSSRRDNQDHLSLILQHEYLHIRHLDAIRKLVMLTVVSLHWFNPLVWIMWITYNKDIEYACDESVIKSKGVEYKTEYSYVLVDSVKRIHNHDMLNSYLCKSSMEERISLIMKQTKRTFSYKLLSLAILASLLVIMFTAQKINASSTDQDYVDFNNFSSATQNIAEDTYSDKMTTLEVPYLPNSN